MNKMKKFFLILVIAFGLIEAKGQITINRSGPSVIVQDARLSVPKNLIIPRYNDTTQANADLGLDSIGAIIFTRSDSKVWKRVVGAPKHWVEMITSFTESDPIFLGSYAHSITGTNISNWNTAYGWGNHASAGYLTSAPVPSIFGRTGAITAQSGDYTFAQIGSKPTSLSGYGITDAYPLSGNPSGFLTSFSESDPVWLTDKPSYLTNSSAAATYALLSHTHTFTSLTSKPSSLSGYGITDAYPLSGNPAGFLTSVPVTSVFGRTGAVTAQTNDYTFAQLASKPTSLSGYGITDAFSLLTNTGFKKGALLFFGSNGKPASDSATLSRDSASGAIGIGVNPLTNSWLNLGASTSSKISLRITPGSDYTGGIINGGFYFNGTNIIGMMGTQRYQLFQQDTIFSQRKAIFEGDSYSSSATNKWIGPFKDSSAFFGHAQQIINAVGGETTTQMVSEYPTESHLNRPTKAGDDYYFFIYAGINDLLHGVFADSIYKNLKREWASSKNDVFKVVAFTVIKSGYLTTAEQASADSLNNMILNTPVGLYDYVVNTASKWNWFADPTQFVDSTHLTTAAFAAMGGYVAYSLSHYAFPNLTGAAGDSSKLNNKDTLAMQINEIRGIALSMPSLFTSPNISIVSNHIATLSPSLLSQAAYSIIATGGVSGAPGVITGIDSNYIKTNSLPVSRMASMPAYTIISNNTAGSANPTNVTQTALFSNIDTVFRPHVGYSYFNDFVSSQSTNYQDLTININGTGATLNGFSVVDASNTVGVIGPGTGSTSTGSVVVRTNPSAIRLGGATWVYQTRINVQALSNGTDTYSEIFGFFDCLATAPTANQVDGVYFLYDQAGVSTGSTASANWQLVTTSNSIRTFTATSTAVTASSWVTLRIEINASGTSATFYVNGTSVGTVTTNIPASSGRETGYGSMTLKSAGTNSAVTAQDYVFCQSIFTNPR